MNGTRIKVCGITTPGDAQLAASLGADYIGVIFADSPRRVDIERAREIRAAVSGSTLVGVFRDQDIEDVVRITRDSGVDMVQLHGKESPEFCDAVLARTGKPVIKAFDSSRIPGTDELAAYATTSYFLFDLDRGGPPGRDATDRIWNEVSRTRSLGFRVFLAGGLDPANVREATRRTQAFAVDVCRGVESAPGVKDAGVLGRFFTEARA